MGLRHIALFRFSDATSEDDVAEITRALERLRGEIPQVRAYRVGADLGLSEAAWDYGVVADFDDRAAYEAYRDHPEHRRVVAELITPHVTERASAQIRT